MHQTSRRAARPRFPRYLCALAVALSAGLLLPALGMAAPPTVVARTGAATPAGGTYNSLSTTPVASETGQLAFTSTVTGATFSAGLFAGPAGALQAVALVGNAAPSGGNYAGLTGASLVSNSQGRLAFTASLTTAPGGLFAGLPGSLQTIALTGAAAPSGGNFNGFSSPLLLNDNGQVAFRSDLSGGSSSRGIFFASAAGSLQTVALVGSAAPAGGNYSALGGNPVLNDAGQLAFAATLSGGSATAGIFAGAPGALQTIALQGATAPGSGGAAYSSFVNPVMNGSGRVVFAANLTGGTAASGLYGGISGSVQAIAVQGNPAPAGGNYGSLLNTPVLNDLGQIAFNANLTGGSATSGLFFGLPGALQAVALQGDPTPAGGTYLSIGFPVLNAVGQLAFTSSLTGAGVTTANDAALFGFSGGAVFPLLREGDALDVDPGAPVDLRTVSSFSFPTGAGGEDGRPSPFNDAGLFVYRVGFTDGTTAILTSAIPEPSTLALGLLASLGLLARRPRPSRR